MEVLSAFGLFESQIGAQNSGSSTELDVQKGYLVAWIACQIDTRIGPPSEVCNMPSVLPGEELSVPK